MLRPIGTSYQAQLQTLTCNAIVHLEQMHQELAQIRAQGVVMDREENELGISCITMPII